MLPPATTAGLHAWTLTLSSRLLLNFPVSREDDDKTYEHVPARCALWGTNAQMCQMCTAKCYCPVSCHKCHKRFSFKSELGQIWSMWLLYDQRPYCPTAHTHWAYLLESAWTRKGQAFDWRRLLTQLSWPVLSRSTARLSGIQSIQGYIQSSTGIAKNMKAQRLFHLTISPLVPFSPLGPCKKEQLLIPYTFCHLGLK